MTQDEFELFEDRVPQKVDAFEHVVIRPARLQDTRHEPSTVAESRAALENPRARHHVGRCDTICRVGESETTGAAAADGS